MTKEQQKAVDACIEIFENFSEYEIRWKALVVRDAWEAGKECKEVK